MTTTVSYTFYRNDNIRIAQVPDVGEEIASHISFNFFLLVPGPLIPLTNRSKNTVKTLPVYHPTNDGVNKISQMT